ncbi:hypothetical protein DFH94DRAFT_723445 [Russula ochroleuca]|uniref:Citrate transporter-like domain-containing protein n=1 Tax=Russula ochroleuca TaxID=152965 RepID=A0A9P5N0Y4_9AGAM|nr:hypothetical protein DFH94DRAFT_723445 [Russula ochroleuca]
MDSEEVYALCPNSIQLSNIADGRSILTLVVFFLSNIIVIFPFRIPLPRIVASTSHDVLVKFRILPRTSEPLRRPYLSVNFLSGPMISVLLLIAVKAINGAALKHGIVGTDGILPISIMALFISLAYLSISLDATGLLRFLAFWVAKKGGSSGRKLYFYLYLFFLVCAAVVGNDPVVLSGTTFLAYLTRVLGITPPTAWIFSQFAAVNMASAVLISSNPTNLVLSGAFSLSFVTYTSSVALPFLAAALIVYLYLSLVLFRSVEYIPPSIELPSGGVGDDGVGIDRPSAALIDKAGAIFGSILLMATLGALTGTSTVGIPVWQVAVPAAAMMLSHDLWRDWRCYRAHRAMAKEQAAEELSVPPTVHPEIELQDLPFSPSRPNSHTVRHSRRQLALSTVLSMWSHSLVQTFPTVYAVYRQLPLSLVPFAFLMFILVQGLTSQGWVAVFACWWGAWVDKTGVVGAAGGMLIGSGLLCNICGTNIGTTILLARMLQEWEAVKQPVATRVRYASVYGLALGSNYGAFTLAFSASLAGLLWRDMLRQKGIHVRQYHFAKLNMGTFMVASVASGVVLIGQTLVVHA